MALTDGPKLGVIVDGAQGELHYLQLMRRWRALDSLIQANVISTLSAPPVSPSDGDTYVVGVGATGDWTGEDNNLARWSAKVAEWDFYVPKAGWLLWDNASGEFLFFDGSEWSSLAVGLGVVGSNLGINAQTGATYTLVLSDAGKLVTLDNASPITLTVPDESSVDFALGTQILLAQLDAQVTVAEGATGVSIITPETYSLRKAGAQAALVKIAADTWLLEGNLEAA